MLKMLIRILNTLRSRIWDIVFFLFSVEFKSIVGKNGNSPEGHGFSRQNEMLSATEQNQTYKHSLSFRR